MNIMGQNEPDYIAGLSVAVPRASNEANKERLRIRKCLVRMVWGNDINFARMVTWLRGLNDRSIKVFQSKEELCQLLDVKTTDEDLQCYLDLYDPTGFGVYDFRTLLTTMMSTTEAEIKVKAQFIFRLWRQRKTGKCTFIELESMMRATYLSVDSEEIAAKAKRIGDSIAVAELTIEDFMDIVERFPAVVFPYEFMEKLTAEQVRAASTKPFAPPPPSTTGATVDPRTVAKK